MLKSIILVWILGLAAIGSSQNMLIHQKGGAVIRVPLSNIQKLTFVMPTTGMQGDRSSALKHMKMAISNIFPNPFNPSTSIRYSVSQKAQVAISVIDMNGKLVRILEQGNKMPGDYFIEWNGKEENGKQAASGTYLTTITVGNKVLSKKMILLK